MIGNESHRTASVRIDIDGERPYLVRLLDALGRELTAIQAEHEQPPVEFRFGPSGEQIGFHRPPPLMPVSGRIAWQPAATSDDVEFLLAGLGVGSVAELRAAVRAARVAAILADELNHCGTATAHADYLLGRLAGALAGLDLERVMDGGAAPA